jgi:hypothetical protein
MNQLFQDISVKFEQLVASDFKRFDQVAGMVNIMGVYAIYDEKLELIYVGNTNKFNIRFGTDLKHESTHTLLKNLIKSGRFLDRKEGVDFLRNQCKVKVEECNSKREAEALVHMAIYILGPRYNK